jgi:hypothetical protein
MLFPTITFAVFFLLVFTGNWLLMPRPRLWKPFILLTSLVFYGWWERRFVLLLGLSAVAAGVGEGHSVALTPAVRRDGGRRRPRGLLRGPRPL